VEISHHPEEEENENLSVVSVQNELARRLQEKEDLTRAYRVLQGQLEVALSRLNSHE
jgi:hypothetical protein